MSSIMDISVELTGNSSGLTKAVSTANSSLNSLGATSTKTSGLVAKLGSMGPLLQAGLGLSVLAVGKAFLMAGIEAEQMEAQTVAGLESTAGASNMTLASIEALAVGIMSYSGISDEAVQSGENMLLTFTNITNQVGEGNDIFNQATVALADMATRMSGGVTPSAEAMSSAAIKLGKSLNDPIAGMSALSRVGVQFTAAQKASITAMVQAGDVMGAQKVILAELTTEFGGSAAAMGGTFVGAWNIMKETVMNVVETVVRAIFSLVTPIISALIPAFQMIGVVVGAVASVIAAAFGLIAPLMPALVVGALALGAGILVAALAFGVFDAAIGTAVAATAAFLAAWAPIVAVVTLFGAVIIGVFKLVQAGMSALSGGWTSMSTIMKVAVLALAPVWLPIVAVIKVVQAVIAGLIQGVSAVAGAVGSMVSSWLAGMGPIGTAIQNVGTILTSLGDIAAANATTAAHEFQTMGLAVVAAAQQGSAGMGTLTQTIAAMRQQLEFADPAKWAAQFQAGLSAVDNALKAGTLSAADAQKAFMAWGLSSSEAAKRTAAALPPVGQSAQQMASSMVKAADVSASGWEKLGAKVQTSMKAIAKAMLSSQKAAMNLAKNTTTVTSKLTSQYGLTADQAAKFLAGATPKSMAAMAKAGGKSFAVVGSAAQKLNGVMPTVATGAGKVAKAVDGAGKSATAAAKGATTLGKGVEGVGKSASTTTGKATGLGKATQSVGSAFTSAAKTAQSAASGTEKLGSSMSGSTGKVNSMTSSVAKLAAELNGLPTKITIEVEVHVTKTGAETGGVTGLARGGVTTKTSGLPLTMVGERGPELAALPPGTRVFSHNDTMGMLRSAADSMPSTDGGGGGEQTIRGKLTLVNGEAFIEGVIVDTLEDGRLVNQVLSRSMRRPG